MRSAPACSSTREAKAASISLSVAAFRIASLTPLVRAACCTSPSQIFGLLGFTSRAITRAWGNQLRQQFEPLGHQLDEEESEARQVAPRPGETGDQTGRDRVAAGEDDRD